MAAIDRILIAYDDSDSSQRLLDYVARLAGGRDDLGFCLFHLLAGPPPEFREHLGAEDPQQERRLAEKIQQRAHAWIREHRPEVEQMLERARGVLIEHGTPAAAIGLRIEPDFGERKLAEACLEAAAQEDCATIAIGRDHSSHFADWLTGRSSSSLVRKAEGLAVWVVQ